MNKSKQLREQIKKKTILTFYTRTAFGDVVLESRVLDRIDQSKDIYELKIHVKMPSETTKEFRNALKQARKAILEEVRNLIGEDETSLDFKIGRSDVERNNVIIGRNKLRYDLIEKLSLLEGEK